MRILLLSLLGWLTACSVSAVKPVPAVDFSDPDKKFYNVALLVMDGVYNTELTAPYDIFQHTAFREGIRPMKTFTVAADREPVTTFEGMRILPDLGYLTDSLPRIDILVVPSAEHHLDTDLENEDLLDFVRRVHGKRARALNLAPAL